MDLTDYVTVAERLHLLFNRWPDARITTDPARVVEIGPRVFIAVTATVWRGPDDDRPCVAESWEPFPGRTAFTRDSEIENASTSAIGRAIAMMGIAAQRSIASADEIRARQSDGTVSAAEAKHALLAALDGDKTAAAALWDTQRWGATVAIGDLNTVLDELAAPAP